MGRIKSTLVKRTTKNLLKEGIPFEEGFNRNKIILGSTMPSKKMRNKMAGYVSRLMKMQRVKTQAEANKVKVPQEDLGQ